MAHNFTTCLKNNWVVSSAKHCLGVGTNVAYFKNRSKITKIASCSPTLWRCDEIKCTLFQGLVCADKSSRSHETLVFSTLSCWKVRHFFVYCMISSHMFGQKYPYSKVDSIVTLWRYVQDHCPSQLVLQSCS